MPIHTSYVCYTLINKSSNFISFYSLYECYYTVWILLEFSFPIKFIILKKKIVPVSKALLGLGEYLILIIIKTPWGGSDYFLWSCLLNPSHWAVVASWDSRASRFIKGGVSPSCCCCCCCPTLSLHQSEHIPGAEKSISKCNEIFIY